MNRNSENGNVLFLILIAVALFAALSYAVTQSSTNISSFSEEDAETEASRILSFFAEVENSVNYMLSVEGTSITQLDFRYDAVFCNDAVITQFTNDNCSSTECRIFDAQGGGLRMQYFTDLALTCADLGFEGTGNFVPGYLLPQIMKIDHVGSDANEVVITLQRMNIEICRAINRLVGAPSNPRYNLLGETSYNFAGSSPTDDLDAGDARTIGDDYDDLDGFRTFCLETNSTSSYGTVYHVVVPR